MIDEICVNADEVKREDLALPEGMVPSEFNG